ncbi:MAG: N-acetylmuramoyl-L-alanine amidase [Polyangiales bacterium]
MVSTRRPTGARGAGRARAVAFLALTLVAAGCGRAGEPTGPADAPLPTDAEAYALPAERLEALERAQEARARALGFGAGASQARREAARLARLRGVRDGDAAALERARGLLVQAAADRGAGSVGCLASLDLARLLARDLGDTRAARDDAERALAELPRSADLAGCRAELARLARLLGGAGIDEPPATVSPASATGPSRLTSVDVYGDAADPGGTVRVVVGFERPAAVELVEEATAPGSPRRVLLRLTEVTVGTAVRLPREVGGGGLVRIRLGDAREKVRDLVFELAPGATVRSFALGEPYRWVLDFERASSGPPPSSPEHGPIRVVLLDPGHGGDQHGARVDGVRESHLVMDIARRTASVLLRRLPGTRILLTRDDDVDVTLEQRAAMANSVDADVFVSIHLNDAPGPVERGGITTFVLDLADERQEVRLAARENGTSEESVTGMQRILAGLHRADQVAESRRLAELVHASTLGSARRVLPAIPDRGVKAEMFYVLVGARMPAILVEASFMTRPEELAALRTAAYRQSLAEGIAEGIARYAATRTGDPP